MRTTPSSLAVDDSYWWPRSAQCAEPWRSWDCAKSSASEVIMHDLAEFEVHACFVCGRPVDFDVPDAVQARRVIGTVAMNGDRQNVKGPGVAFHRACFTEARGLWVEVT